MVKHFAHIINLSDGFTDFFHDFRSGRTTLIEKSCNLIEIITDTGKLGDQLVYLLIVSDDVTLDGVSAFGDDLSHIDGRR